MTRTEKLLTISKRLIIMTACALCFIVALFAYTLIYGERFLASWACFGCGLLGGFVSIQQRLKRIGDEELTLLAQSWFQVLLIPVYGGIFALVLYIGFLSTIIEGSLFPQFSSPPFSEPVPTTKDIQDFFMQTYPATGTDLAKLLFWSFLAGFSERFVPQVLDQTQKKETAKEA
ncbi:hypothetical protein [Gimesia fumaroli]|uniref:DUF4199 domain-containing protein n=1 Tax=Gimesia fumaroli TaxID=2527976 RepID=A0A518IB12_9PLAN|nr:hypothetical protein [Gimesia fumaroli]QDV50303.1 hypothetical protein Enr17x_23410 [Gimesia fumaroli]